MEQGKRNKSVRLLAPTSDGLQALYSKEAPPDWVARRFQDFHELVTNKREVFPCYFATIAEEVGALRYSYVLENEAENPEALRGALLTFLRRPAKERPRSALVVFTSAPRSVSPSPAELRKQFWDLVQALHDLDSSPWPADVPSDPNDPHWSFCFGGRPIFIAGHSPHYVNRRSRKSSDGLFLVIQPRSNLKGIAGKGRTADRVRERIRGLLRSYDSVPPSPDLGVYGDPSSREWRQYWLPDTNQPGSGPCPLLIRAQRA